MKNNSTLVKNLLSDFRINIYFQNISLALIGTLILAFSSKVQVPFWPVPMTMQTFVVFIIGMTFGSKLAFFTLLLYLFEGAIGLPVFAKGGGFAYLMGPAVRLEFALVQFAYDILERHNFIPVVPPVLVREEMMIDAGFFPTDRHQVYEIAGDELVGRVLTGIPPMSDQFGTSPIYYNVDDESNKFASGLLNYVFPKQSISQK